MPRGGSIYWDAVLRKDSQQKVLQEAKALHSKLQEIFSESNGLSLISDQDLEQLKKAARQTDPFRQKVRELANEMAILRNRLKSGTISEAEFREEMARVKRETISLTTSAKNLSTAQKTLTATSAGATRALDNLNKQQRLNSILQNASTTVASRYGVSLEGIRSPALLAGAGIAALAFGLVQTVRVAGDFEKRMNVVKSVVEGTDEQFRQLKDRARDLGTTTVFSASQVADAMKALSLAGFKTEQILAAISGTLNLAVVGAIDLEQAADITVNVLNQFGLAATETDRVINTLVYGVNAATINVEDMAESMKYLGPIARSLGDNVETATAIIAVLGNNGLKGTLATRALGTALVRLAKPTKQMVEKMEELNLEFYDAEGNFIGLVPMIAELEGALDGATQEQKQNTLATLFGNEAIQEMLILLDAGSEGLNNILKDMDKAGNVAERTAKTQLEGFNAAWLLLRRSIEGVGITLGNFLLPVLSVVFRALASFFNLINTGLRTLEKFQPGLSESAAKARDFNEALGLFSSTAPDVVTAIDDIKAAVGDNDKEGLREAVGNLANYMTGEAKASFLAFANDAIDKAKSVDEAWTLTWKNMAENAKKALQTDLLVKEQLLADFDRNRDPNVSIAGSGAVMAAASDAFQNDEDLKRLADLYQRNVIDNFFGDLAIPPGLAVTDLLEEGLTIDKERLTAQLSEGYDLFDEDIDELYGLLNYYEDIGTKLRTARDVATNLATSAAPISIDDPRRQKLVEDIESSKKAIDQLPTLIDTITTTNIENAESLGDGLDTGTEILGDSIANLEATLDELNAAYESATTDDQRNAILSDIKEIEGLLELLDKRREPKKKKGEEIPPAGSLAALRKALSEAEELRDKATSEAARAAANDVVKSLEEQIKAIEDTFKTQKVVAGSLADLREQEVKAVEEFNLATTESERQTANEKVKIVRDQIAQIEDIYDTSKDAQVEAIASQFDLLQSQLGAGLITQDEYKRGVEQLRQTLDAIIPTLNSENEETQKAIALKADLNKALDTTKERQKELKAIIEASVADLTEQFSQSIDNLEDLSAAELAQARSTLDQRLAMVQSWGSAYQSLIPIIQAQLKELDEEAKRRLQEFRQIASDLIGAASEARRSLEELATPSDSLGAARSDAEAPFNDIIQRALENIEELNSRFSQLSDEQKEQERKNFQGLVAQQQSIIESAILARAEAVDKAEKDWSEAQQRGVVDRQRALTQSLYDNKAITYQTYVDLLKAERDYWESVVALAQYGSAAWLEAYQRIAEINKLIDPFSSLGLGDTKRSKQGRPGTVGEFAAPGANENLGTFTGEGIVLSAQEIVDATKIAADTWRVMVTTGADLSAKNALDAAGIIWDTMLAQQKALALQRFGSNDSILQSLKLTEARTAEEKKYLERVKAGSQIMGQYNATIDTARLKSIAYNDANILLEESIQATNLAIDALIAEGWDPMSSRVQSLVKELGFLEVELSQDAEARQNYRSKLIAFMTTMQEQDSILVKFGKSLFDLAINKFPGLSSAIAGFEVAGVEGAIVAFLLEMLQLGKPFLDLLEMLSKGLYPIINALQPLAYLMALLLEPLSDLTTTLAPIIDILLRVITPAVVIVSYILKGLAAILKGITNVFIAIYNFLLGWLFGRIAPIDDPSRTRDPNPADPTKDDREDKPLGETFNDNISSMIGKPAIALSPGTPNVGTTAVASQYMQSGDMHLKAANIQLQAAKLMNETVLLMRNRGDRSVGGAGL